MFGKSVTASSSRAKVTELAFPGEGLIFFTILSSLVDIVYIRKSQFESSVEGEELAELQNLHDCTYELTQRFYENGYMTFRHSLMHNGPIPEKEKDIQASPDGPAWCWWLILTLPLDVTRKLAVFSDTSLKSRLTQLKNILNVVLESSEFNS
ncbi:PREDICTED: LON peptidase N-terminal domain and RING finger protein 1-like [Gekko japonicus]|uniref:LON peptidase N-terminal domain and RING finger protein 1-like n=1 Tax=Gekko japonicus TaxID=146911 RepID=A0ABM1KY59_GEKJA|nr:PREDICTED: LON peptidase N-terminal domain and RING finger protein 1-like [Gekko japonicus]